MDRATNLFSLGYLVFRCFYLSRWSASRAMQVFAKQTADFSPERRFDVGRWALRRKLTVSLLCALLFCWAPSIGAQQVIVNGSVPLQFVSKSTLRAIFGMRMRNWPDDTPITVFVLASDAPVHTAFCKEILNMFPHQLQRAWDRLVYSGTGQAPIIVESLEEMAEKIGNTPGAVGYMDRAFIDGRVRALNIR